MKHWVRIWLRDGGWYDGDTNISSVSLNALVDDSSL